jgi:uncharacterized protein
MTVKAVFHIDEMKNWGLLLNNVNNLLSEVEAEGSCIEIVANSAAVHFYVGELPEEQSSLVGELFGRGVRFAACANSMRALGISSGQLRQEVEVIPSAVLELILRQEKGFAYIKP